MGTSRRIVVKIGSQALCDDSGALDGAVIASIASEIAGLRSGGWDVVLVSSADETAFALADRLRAEGLLTDDRDRPAARRFISSGDVSWFADLGRRLLGPELAEAEAHRWT